jgi:hypothetical protein
MRQQFRLLRLLHQLLPRLMRQQLHLGQQSQNITTINVDQTQRSWTNKIDLIVRSVEILPDNTMKWNLTFWNQDPQSDISIGFDYSQTFLSDEFGNKYEIVSDSAHTGPKDLFSAKIEPEVRLEHTIIFPSPRDGAKVFKLGLINPCCYAAWKVFSVSLK